MDRTPPRWGTQHRRSLKTPARSHDDALRRDGRNRRGPPDPHRAAAELRSIVNQGASHVVDDSQSSPTGQRSRDQRAVPLGWETAPRCVKGGLEHDLSPEVQNGQRCFDSLLFIGAPITERSEGSFLRRLHSDLRSRSQELVILGRFARGDADHGLISWPPFPRAPA